MLLTILKWWEYIVIGDFETKRSNIFLRRSQTSEHFRPHTLNSVHDKLIRADFLHSKLVFTFCSRRVGLINFKVKLRKINSILFKVAI